MPGARSFYARRGKRLFDVLLAVPALLLLSPLLLLLAAVLRWRLGAPVFFRQQRPGLHGEIFTCIKFRTMTDARDAQGNPLPDGDRLTGLGRWMRRFSLDELPQLWTVLQGDMSLVGPRPLLIEYLGRYSPEQARRHDVKPGITGWSQVNGRNELSWERRFELDVWYVDHVRLWLDLRILAESVWQVVAPRGISHAGHATMPKFMGSNSAEQRAGK